MIDRHGKNALPESDYVAWTCPNCGAQQPGMSGFPADAECPECRAAATDRIFSDWFDFRDPAERKAG
jgi:predicted RNA-binding Zn-ribbon protein involved in translation (DUF1610 family)